MNSFKQVFIGNSVYAEFLYLLRFPEKVSETLFLVGPSCTAIDVPNRLPIVGPRNPDHLPMFRELIAQQCYLLLKGEKVPCYGNVETIFSSFFVNNFPFYPITDGLWDIKKFPLYLMDPKRFIKCYSVRYPGGLDLENDRLELMNIPALWKKLNRTEQKIFLQRFGSDENMLKSLGKRKILLVTQPLSEDNITTEEDKINIYRSIMKNYDESQVILKVHPREHTDWQKIFPNIVIVPQLLPAELLCLLMDNLEKMVTFFSTSACTAIAPEKVDFYAKDFGKLHLMKENRFNGDIPLRPLASFDVEKALREKNNFNWLRIPDNSLYED